VVSDSATWYWLSAGNSPSPRRGLTLATAGEDRVWREVIDLAAALAAVYAHHPAVTAAVLAAEGIRPVTIAHGVLDDQAAELIHRVLPGLAASCGLLGAVRSTAEHTTYLFTGPDADHAAAAFTERVLEIAPGCWQISPTAYPAEGLPQPPGRETGQASGPGWSRIARLRAWICRLSDTRSRLSVRSRLL
jgi:hypothetical protein